MEVGEVFLMFIFLVHAEQNTTSLHPSANTNAFSSVSRQTLMFLIFLVFILPLRYHRFFKDVPHVL